MKLTVVTDFDVEGFHRWENAPEDLYFLAFRHRHLFRIRIHQLVSHTDRQKEIFTEESRAKEFLHIEFGTPCEFEGMSCEDIGKALLKYMPDCHRVEVYEDAKGGAIVEL